LKCLRFVIQKFWKVLYQIFLFKWLASSRLLIPITTYNVVGKNWIQIVLFIWKMYLLFSAFKKYEENEMIELSRLTYFKSEFLLYFVERHISSTFSPVSSIHTAIFSIWRFYCHKKRASRSNKIYKYPNLEWQNGLLKNIFKI